MTSDHFFIPKNAVAWPRAVLSGDQHRHLSIVVRSRPGDEVWLFDEGGTRYGGRIETVDKDRTVLSLLARALKTDEPRVRIVLAQALLKPKAMDFVIKKATELGAAEVVPVPAGLPERVIIAVGPEGGWTGEEEGIFRSRGFGFVSLGPRTFRAETASLAALALIDRLWNT